MERSRRGVSKSTCDFRSSSYRSLRFFSPLDMAERQPSQARIICPMLRHKLVTQIRPKYPKEARNRGEVFLRLIIEADGPVGEIELSARKEPLLQAAKTAWKYEPIGVRPSAIQSDTTVDITF